MEWSIKEESAIQPEGRDAEQAKAESLLKFKAKIKDPEHGHLITEFSGCHELASRLAGDLHNWLFDRYYAPALSDAAKGNLSSEQTTAVSDDLRRLATINRDLQAQVAEEKRLLDEQRRIALEAFFQLTYDVPNILARFPDTLQDRESLVRNNLKYLDQLFKLNSSAHDVLRELATNYRLLASILMEQQKLHQSYEAFKKSGDYCASLIKLQPYEALYHRDLAVSRFNTGVLLEQMGDPSGAQEEYSVSLQSANRAAELDPQWSDLARNIRQRRL